MSKSRYNSFMPGVYASGSQPGTATPGKLRRWAREGGNTAGALQREVNRLFRTERQGARPLPHIIHVEDVFKGLNLDSETEGKLTRVLTETRSEFGATAATRVPRIVHARIQLSSVLNAMKHVDSDARMEIRRRAQAYWKRNHPDYDRMPTIRYVFNKSGWETGPRGGTRRRVGSGWEYKGKDAAKPHSTPFMSGKAGWTGGRLTIGGRLVPDQIVMPNKPSWDPESREAARELRHTISKVSKLVPSGSKVTTKYGAQLVVQWSDRMGGSHKRSLQVLLRMPEGAHMHGDVWFSPSDIRESKLAKSQPWAGGFSRKEAARAAKALKVDFSREKFGLSALVAGMAIEREHGDVSKNAKVIAKITLAHLRELPDYYKRLRQVEEDAHKSEGRRMKKSDAFRSAMIDVTRVIQMRGYAKPDDYEEPTADKDRDGVPNSLDVAPGEKPPPGAEGAETKGKGPPAEGEGASEGEGGAPGEYNAVNMPPQLTTDEDGDGEVDGIAGAPVSAVDNVHEKETKDGKELDFGNDVKAHLPNDGDYHHHAVEYAKHRAGHLVHKGKDDAKAEAHKHAANIHAAIGNALHQVGDVERRRGKMEPEDRAEHAVRNAPQPLPPEELPAPGGPLGGQAPPGLPPGEQPPPGGPMGAGPAAPNGLPPQGVVPPEPSPRDDIVGAPMPAQPDDLRNEPGRDSEMETAKKMAGKLTEFVGRMTGKGGDGTYDAVQRGEQRNVMRMHPDKTPPTPRPKHPTPKRPMTGHQKHSARHGRKYVDRQDVRDFHLPRPEMVETRPGGQLAGGGTRARHRGLPKQMTGRMHYVPVMVGKQRARVTGVHPAATDVTAQTRARPPAVRQAVRRAPEGQAARKISGQDQRTQARTAARTAANRPFTDAGIRAGSQRAQRASNVNVQIGPAHVVARGAAARTAGASRMRGRMTGKQHGYSPSQRDAYAGRRQAAADRARDTTRGNSPSQRDAYRGRTAGRTRPIRATRPTRAQIEIKPPPGRRQATAARAPRRTAGARTAGMRGHMTGKQQAGGRLPRTRGSSSRGGRRGTTVTVGPITTTPQRGGGGVHPRLHRTPGTAPEFLSYRPQRRPKGSKSRAARPSGPRQPPHQSTPLPPSLRNRVSPEQSLGRELEDRGRRALGQTPATRYQVAGGEPRAAERGVSGRTVKQVEAGVPRAPSPPSQPAAAPQQERARRPRRQRGGRMRRQRGQQAPQAVPSSGRSGGRPSARQLYGLADDMYGKQVGPATRAVYYAVTGRGRDVGPGARLRPPRSGTSQGVPKSKREVRTVHGQRVSQRTRVTELPTEQVRGRTGGGERQASTPAPRARGATRSNLGRTGSVPPIPASARRAPTPEHRRRMNVAEGRAGARRSRRARTSGGSGPADAREPAAAPQPAPEPRSEGGKPPARTASGPQRRTIGQRLYGLAGPDFVVPYSWDGGD